MATKLLRKTFYQFAVTANPASEIGQFGSYAAPDYSGDVEVMQSGTAWPRGWFGETINTNRPFIQDMNAIDFVFSYMIFYLMQMGIAEYDNSTLYWLNSIVQIAGQIYISLQDNNSGNPPGTSPTFWQSGLPGSELSGVIKAFAGSVAPAGYLLCQGQAVSRSTYAALFTICGTAYGVGDGSTTFNIPNLSGKVPVGQLNTDPNFASLGQVGGEDAHLLTVSEIPAHSHGIATNDLSNSGGTGSPFESQASPNLTYPTQQTGGGAVHNNLQPYLTISYIIKT